MEKRRAVLVARDFFESKIISGLAQKLEGNFLCSTFVGEGKSSFPTSTIELRGAVEVGDVVIVAVSENCSIEAQVASLAKEYSKPLVVVALSYNAWRQIEFIPVHPHVCVLFVLDDKEAYSARKLYPNATIIASGNPEWEKFSFPTHTATEVRNILGFDKRQRRKLIIIPGEKEVGVNFPLAVNVIEAVASLPDPGLFRIIFTIHPGHTPFLNGSNPLKFYEELQAYSHKVFVRPSYKTTPFGIGTSDMVPGADLVIGSNSTVQIQAAYLGIPVIAVLLQRAFRGVELPQEHKEWWPPCDRGAIAPVYGLSSARTAKLIESLLTKEGFASMKSAQERYFPRFERVGQAYETMVKAIEQI